jgi:hypothetical protein
MKTLELNEMEVLEGGTELENDLAACGQQIFWNFWLGGIVLGGAGAVIGVIAGATGPGCLGWW